MDPECELCKDEMWICAEHPNKPPFHDNCGSEGETCSCNPDGQLPKTYKICCEAN